MTEQGPAMVFPGQGAQTVGMLSDLAARFGVVQQTFTEASDKLGRDLWSLVVDGPQQALDRTENTQPAMLAAGVSAWRCWQHENGPRPTVMAGHSLGEYTALVCAGSLRFADAVKLVAERARLMQEAVPEGRGAMAAILGLDDDSVRALCREEAKGDVLEAVNFNAPGQVVIAGDRPAVERAATAAKAVGAKRALLLPVSVPSHCALMKDAATELAAILADTEIQMPTIAVLHNVSVAEAASVDDLRELLARQLYSPVRWVETIEALARRGVPAVVEAGPGKVLTGLGKRIDKALPFVPVLDPPSLSQALETTTHA